MTTLSSSLTTLLGHCDMKCGAPAVVGPRVGWWLVPAATIARDSLGSGGSSSRRYHLLAAAIQAQRDQYREHAIAHYSIRKSPKKSWQCFAEAEKTEAESSKTADSSSVASPPDCCNDSSTVAGAVKQEAATSIASGPVFETYGPDKRQNQLVALASVTIAVGLFLSGRFGAGGPGLPELAAAAIPYQEALSNGKPTVVEFYADWCEVCKETAHDVYQIELEYKDQINFVMLNVDNSKWEEELDEFGVEGIPHFAFLDRQGNEEGNIVGRLPKKILKENLAALARGDTTVPHSRVVAMEASKLKDSVASTSEDSVSQNSVHEFIVKDASGNAVDLSTYKGKVLLIVNVASQCGLTKTNYKELTEIHNRYKDQGFEILAFPCNQFGGQEPGTNEEIKQFASAQYKAEFPIFDKVNVNGGDTAPLYKFLKSSKNGGNSGDLSIQWNFSKFLVDKEGKVVDRYAPMTRPSEIENDIKKLL